MSDSQHMASLRRRPMPGMASSTPSPSEAPRLEPPMMAVEVIGSLTPAQQDPSTKVGDLAQDHDGPRSANRAERSGDGQPSDGGVVRRRPAADYSSTRLVNFRIPVDLHDRYRQLVRDVEVEFPRLRHPSLTELIIALLEEGPSTPEDVAELIRRKRVAEHDPGVSS